MECPSNLYPFSHEYWLSSSRFDRILVYTGEILFSTQEVFIVLESGLSKYCFVALILNHVQWTTIVMTSASMYIFWRQGSWLLWPTVILLPYRGFCLRSSNFPENVVFFASLLLYLSTMFWKRAENPYFWNRFIDDVRWISFNIHSVELY